MAMIYSNMIMKKEFIRVSHGTTYLGHRNWGEDMKNLPGQSSSKDLKQAHPKYKAGKLITRLDHDTYVSKNGCVSGFWHQYIQKWLLVIREQFTVTLRVEFLQPDFMLVGTKTVCQ